MDIQIWQNANKNVIFEYLYIYMIYYPVFSVFKKHVNCQALRCNI